MAKAHTMITTKTHVTKTQPILTQRQSQETVQVMLYGSVRVSVDAQHLLYIRLTTCRSVFWPTTGREPFLLA